MLERAPEDDGQIDAAAKTLRIIHVVMSMSIVLFAGVACFVGATHAAEPDVDGVATILSGVHVLMALGAYGVAVIVPRVPIKQLPPGASVAEILAALRAGRIVLLAAMEGPALFGLSTLMVAGTGGHLVVHPALYANLLTSVVFVGYALGALPSRDDLRERVHRIQADAALAMGG